MPIEDVQPPTLQSAGYGPPGAGQAPSGSYGGYGAPPGPSGGPPGGGYGGPPGGGFGGSPPGGFGGASGPARVHPLAIVSLVAGLLSLPACCCWFFGFPLPVCAIACGVIALGKIKAAPLAYSGAIFCYVGIACGSFGLLLTSGFHFTNMGHYYRHRYGRGI